VGESCGRFGWWSSAVAEQDPTMQQPALALSLALASCAFAQDSAGPPFRCPEKNGFFADPEQCDKYYECVAEIPEEKFCPDGLLFDATDPNSELCDYPFNVDCGDREYVQEPEPGLDPKCYRANGFFNHEDPTVCTKYYNCVHGYPHAYDCPTPLVFDEAQGTCVREEQSSSFARKCEKTETKPNVEGFECPDGETIGPNGQPLAHPSFPHPTSCRKYINCQFGVNPVELGCTDGLIFDHTINKCVNPEEGPSDCKCWYSCDDTSCPDTCNTDCTCP